jgi:Carboxypeptidase regulatory-like domain/TonB dependent receptor
MFRDKRNVFCLCAFCYLLLVIGSDLLRAQLTFGSITGLITDPNQASVPNAEVTIQNDATSETRRIITGSDGRYTLSQVQPGSYTITVTAAGFQRYVATKINLDVSQNLAYNIGLVLGSPTETVNVSANVPVVDTEDANNSVTLTGKDTVDLPIPTHLALGPVWAQAGTVSIRQGATTNPTVGDQNVSRVALNGGRDESTAVLVDGVSITAGDWGGAMALPSIETVQEFQVLRNTFDTQYGKTDGGVISLSTKSGTNEFHGGAFEYLQNNDLNANTWTNNLSHLPRTAYHLNQFGGHLGGPVIKRKKVFIFGNYEGVRQITPGTLLTTVPTALQRQGDFSQTYNSNGALSVIYNPFTTVLNGTTYSRTPFPNNMIPSSLINSSGKAALALYPQPNAPGNSVTGANNFAAGGTNRNNVDRMDIRPDYVINSQWTLFGTYTRMWQTSLTPIYFGNGADTGYNSPSNMWRALISASYVPTPTWVVNFVVATDTWNQEQLSTSLAANTNGSLYGLPSSLLSQFSANTLPDITVENYSSLSYDRQLLYLQHANDAQVNVSKQLGVHSLKFGYQMSIYQLNDNDQSPATFAFNRGLTSGPTAATDSSTSGNGIASLLLGTMASATAVNNIAPAATKRYLAFYVEDAWKFNSRLTINYGLRYEIQTPLTERYNRQNYFNFTVPNPLSQSTGLNLEGGLVYANANNRGYWNTDYNNFAPRLGLAYKVTEKLVFRTGFGIYFMPTSTSASGDSDGFSVTTTGVTTQNNAGYIPANLFSNPFPNGLNSPTGNSLGLLTDVGNSVNAWDRNHPTSYVQSYSASFQYQILRNAIIEVGYQGSQGRKLPLGYGSFNINQLNPSYLSMGSALSAPVNNPFYGTIAAGQLSGKTVPAYQLLLPYPQFLAVNLPNDYVGASSSYNALNLKFSERFSQGLTALVTYSWSKAIDDTSETQGWEIGDQDRNAYNLAGERSVSAHDVPQYFVTSVVWDLPVGRGKHYGANMNKALDAVVGGWQVAPIVSFFSGLPLQFSCSNTLSTFGYQACRPNITSNDALAGITRSIGEWFNTSPSVISAPAPYTIGTAPRYVPNERFGFTHNTNFTLRKQFSITERLKLGIQASAYNLGNTPTYGRPNTTVGALTFGQVTGVAPGVIPRQVELGVRVTF